jgi:membrane protease subunit HflK
MSNEREHPQPALAATPVDSGSQALAEALRSSFAIVKVVMAVLVAVFIFSGFFTVGPQEKAIILRFGKPVGEGDDALLGAGAHWAFPYPIDEVVKIPITEIQQVKSTTGWFFLTPVQEAAGEEPPPGPSLNPAGDCYAITADGNIVHVKARLSYRIEDPVRCVFGFAKDANEAYGLTGTSNVLQDALNNALLRTAAEFKVDDILTRDRIGFQDAVRRRVTRFIETQQLGVVIEQCDVQPRPPRQLDDAFRGVVRAELNRSKALEEARTYEHKTLSKASADASSIINIAESDRIRTVEDAAGEASLFQGLLARYESNPDLFVQQRLIETAGRVLTNAQEKVYLPTSTDGKPIELRLLLNREPPKQPTQTPAQP